jgi:hypothetical protein
MKITMTTLLLMCATAGANDLKCPEGTESAFEKDKDVTVLFCRRWTEEKVNGKAKPKLVKHGPARITQGDVLVQTGQYEEDKPTGIWKAYFENGSLMLEHPVDENLQRHGKLLRYHPNGKKRTLGLYEHGKEVGQWQFYSPEGSLLAEGTYDKVLPVIEKFDTEQKIKNGAETAKAQLIAQKEFEKRQSEIKKNWLQKDKGKTKAWYDKTGKLHWSTWLGRSNWYNAALKCKNIGWRLPTVEEFNQAVSRGLSELSDEMRQPFWSSIDQSHELDPQRSMVLGDGKAWIIVPGEGEMPGNKLSDENSIICVAR